MQWNGELREEVTRVRLASLSMVPEFLIRNVDTAHEMMPPEIRRQQHICENVILGIDPLLPKPDDGFHFSESGQIEDPQAPLNSIADFGTIFGGGILPAERFPERSNEFAQSLSVQP